MRFNSSNSWHINALIGTRSVARNEFSSLTVVTVENAAVGSFGPLHGEALGGHTDALRLVNNLRSLVDPNV